MSWYPEDIGYSQFNDGRYFYWTNDPYTGEPSVRYRGMQLCKGTYKTTSPIQYKGRAVKHLRGYFNSNMPSKPVEWLHYGGVVVPQSGDNGQYALTTDQTLSNVYSPNMNNYSKVWKRDGSDILGQSIPCELANHGYGSTLARRWFRSAYWGTDKTNQPDYIYNCYQMDGVPWINRSRNNVIDTSACAMATSSECQWVAPNDATAVMTQCNQSYTYRKNYSAPQGTSGYQIHGNGCSVTIFQFRAWQKYNSTNISTGLFGLSSYTTTNIANEYIYRAFGSSCISPMVSRGFDLVLCKWAVDETKDLEYGAFDPTNTNARARYYAETTFIVPYKWQTSSPLVNGQRMVEELFNYLRDYANTDSSNRPWVEFVGRLYNAGANRNLDWAEIYKEGYVARTINVPSSLNMSILGRRFYVDIDVTMKSGTNIADPAYNLNATPVTYDTPTLSGMAARSFNYSGVPGVNLISTWTSNNSSGTMSNGYFYDIGDVYKGAMRQYSSTNEVASVWSRCGSAFSFGGVLNRGQRTDRNDGVEVGYDHLFFKWPKQTDYFDTVFIADKMSFQWSSCVGELEMGLPWQQGRFYDNLQMWTGISEDGDWGFNGICWLSSCSQWDDSEMTRQQHLQIAIWPQVKAFYTPLYRIKLASETVLYQDY